MTGAGAWGRLRERWTPGVECPICGSRVSRFAPFGAPRRRNAMCRGCGSLERHRFLWLLANVRMGLFQPPVTLLHFAPEPCLAERLRAIEGLRYVSTDLASPAVSTRHDITAMGFGGCSFDVVLCAHVLEHVNDDRRAMAEIHRILKPDGVALLQVPLAPHGRPTDEDPGVAHAAERQRRFGQHDHVRLYGADIAARLAAAGFAVEAVSCRAGFGAAAVRRHALVAAGNHDDTVFVCRRTEPRAEAAAGPLPEGAPRTGTSQAPAPPRSGPRADRETGETPGLHWTGDGHRRHA